MHPSACLNCESPLTNTQNFCAVCGQKTATHRLSLHEVGHESLHHFTHADKGIFALLYHLLIKPGVAAREYVQGKRQKYFKPVSFFFIVTAISVLSAGIIASAKKDSIPHAPAVEHTEPASPGALKAERALTIKTFISKYPNTFPIASTPLIAFFLWLFYIRGQYNYTEHLVANMYITGFMILLYSLVVTPLAAALNLPGMNWLLVCYLIFEISYRTAFYYSFINKKTKPALAWALFVSVAVVIFWAVFSNFIIRGYIAGWFSWF